MPFVVVFKKRQQKTNTCFAVLFLLIVGNVVLNLWLGDRSMNGTSVNDHRRRSNHDMDALTIGHGADITGISSIPFPLISSNLQAGQKQQQPQQQNGANKPARRLCTMEEVRQGAWVPVTLDHPPFIPRTSKCYTTEQLEGATSWPYYHWHPFNSTRKECEFLQWDADRFCQLARNKTIALMGDSLTWEQYASLVGLFGRKVGAHNELNFQGDDGKPYSQNRPFSLDICNQTARAAFFRNRYLMYPHWLIEETDPDIIVLNRGAHFVVGKELVEGYPGKEGESGMTALITTLQKHHDACQQQGRKCLAIWRTTSPGHPNCMNFTKPATSVAEMEEWIAYDPVKYPGKVGSYMWWEFKKLNSFILEMFREALSSLRNDFHFDVLPGYDINILRPDTHTGVDDCLHNCDPGAADVYNTVLLHLMRLHYEATSTSL